MRRIRAHRIRRGEVPTYVILLRFGSRYIPRITQDMSHHTMGGGYYSSSGVSVSTSKATSGGSVSSGSSVAGATGQHYNGPEMPPFFAYAQLPAHLARAQPKGAAQLTYFAPSEMRTVCTA